MAQGEGGNADKGQGIGHINEHGVKGFDHAEDDRHHGADIVPGFRAPRPLAEEQQTNRLMKIEP